MTNIPPHGRPRRWRAAVAVPVLAVLLAGSAAPAAGEPLPTPTEHPSTLDAGISSSTGARIGDATSVTLITGDRVHVRPLAGDGTVADIEPALRPGGVVPQFYVTTVGDEVHVVPSDVHLLVPGQLDPALFNVTALVEQGLDDLTSPTLPVILSYRDIDGPGAGLTSAVPAVDRPRVLSSVSAVAADLAKDHAAEFGAALTRFAVDRTTTTSGVGSGADLFAGVEKVWLDRTVEALLDQSTHQIGAPFAWAAELDGTGVTVAVLDTGIDDSHPDLAGKVRAAADFAHGFSEPDPLDRHGHGTHVASIIAGNGAASDGDLQGVAPGVELLNGKVLSDTGSGTISGVIAGMEWAAGEQQADVVNLSLGAENTPLLDQAVDQLSAEHGTLFVVAAGNFGCDSCVSSPGLAPSALTVGAVDRDDQLAEFSSRGPAPGDFSLKPDVTAPGVGIQAARAPGSPFGEGPYLPLSGTSMATPHVAGAAAIMWQDRPDLTWAQVKAMLMSTAVPTDGLTLYEQGTGRIDVQRMLDSPVVPSVASLDLGLFPFPHDERDPVHVTVHYQNVTDEPVELDLSVHLSDPSGDQADPGMVTVTPSQLTVTPGEAGAADVVVDTALGGSGRHAGLLIATLGDGAELRTPVGFQKQPRQVDVTFEVIMRDGRDLEGFAPHVYNVETGEFVDFFSRCGGQPPRVLDLCLRMPVGTYAVLAIVPTQADRLDAIGRVETHHVALVGHPELVIDEDMTITLDAREAVEVSVETPDHDTKPNLGAAANIGWHRAPAHGPPVTFTVFNTTGSQLEERFFMEPMGPVMTGEFAAFSRWQLEAPHITLSVEGTELDLLPQYYPDGDFATDRSTGRERLRIPRLTGQHSLPLVDAGAARAEDIDGLSLEGALALVRRSDDVPVPEQANRAAAAGAALVAIYHDLPGSSQDPGQANLPLDVPTVRLSHEEGLALLELGQSGPVTVVAEGQVASPYQYDLVYTEHDQIPADLHYVAHSAELVRIDHEVFTQLDSEHDFQVDAWPFHPWDTMVISTPRPLFDLPRSYAQYHVFDPQMRWGHAVTEWDPTTPSDKTTFGLLGNPGLSSYPTVGPHRLQWLRAPVTPAFIPQGRAPGSGPVERFGGNFMAVPFAYLAAGDSMPVVLDFFGGGECDDFFCVPTGSLSGGEPARDGGSGGGTLLTTSLQVWRGEELLLDSLRGGALGDFGPHDFLVLPPEEDTYRITYEVAKPTPEARLSTEAVTEWTFRSARTDPAGPPVVLPLMTLAYDIPMDLSNRGLPPRDRRDPPTVGVTAGYPDGADTAPLVGMRLWISFDDGQTWQERPGKQVDDRRFDFVVPDSPAAGEVSLRVEAWDTQGSRIEQEVMRAYGVANR